VGALFQVSMTTFFFAFLTYVFTVLSYIAMVLSFILSWIVWVVITALGFILSWSVWIVDVVSHLGFRFAFPGLLVSLLGTFLIKSDPFKKLTETQRIMVKGVISVALGQGLLFGLDWLLTTGMLSPVMILTLVTISILVCAFVVYVAAQVGAAHARQAQTNTSAKREARNAELDSDDVDIEPTSETSHLCVVCLSRPKSVLARPCRHMVLCSSCIRKLDQCPMCRKPIESLERVFT